MGFQSKTLKQLGLKPIPKWHTPFMPLDFSLGKGFGEGVWIEAFAPEGVGKTTLFLQSALFYLHSNPDTYLLFLDVEKALDFTLIENLSYVPFSEEEGNYFDFEESKLFLQGEERATFAMPDTYEQIDQLTAEFVDFCLKNKKKGIVIWDSLVSAVSEEVLKKGKDKVAYKATKIQEYLEKYLSTFRKVPITFLVVNQIREKLATSGPMMGQDKTAGMMTGQEFHIPGGKAHKFYSFQALMLVPGVKWQYSTSSDLAGRVIKITPTKNKQAPDSREVRLVRLPEYGYSNIISILNFLKDQKLIEGTMATIKLPEEIMNASSKKGNKTTNLPTLCKDLIENPEFLEVFYNWSAKALNDYYKEHKRFSAFYESEIQKYALVLDAQKILRYLEDIL